MPSENEIYIDSNSEDSTEFLRTKSFRMGHSRIADLHTATCPSGAAPGLCSCGVIMRAGTLLLSGERGELENGVKPETVVRDAERWLAVAKSHNCGTLSLSLFRPSTFKRNACSNTGAELNTGVMGLRCGGEGARSADRVRGNEGVQNVQRWRLSLSASWKDWVYLGYGPLQWMSHRQNKFFGRLALSWVEIREQGMDNAELPSRSKLGLTMASSSNTSLRFRPILAATTRVVGTVTRQEAQRYNTPNLDPSETTCNGSTPQSKHVFPDDCVSAVMRSRKESTDPVCLVEDRHGRKGRVTVADGGHVFTVQVIFQRFGKGAGWGESTYFEGTFGIEGWRETGLRELLWLDHCWRQYLARRLSYQVRYVT